MKTWDVHLTATAVAEETIEVEAETEDEAIEKAKNLWLPEAESWDTECDSISQLD